MDTLNRGEGDTCKLCPVDQPPPTATWIFCDACEIWYHITCLFMDIEDFETIKRYHCPECEPTFGPSIYSAIRKSRRNPVSKTLNYADLDKGITRPRSKWKQMLSSKKFSRESCPRLAGKDLTVEYLDKTGFKEPILVKQDPDGTTDGLGMKMPAKSLTVGQIRDAVGGQTQVGVIDVATQSELADWTLDTWADYFKKPVKERIYNVISLEITGTELADKITRPRIVRELDWISKFWINCIKRDRPKVQLYCLMSVKDSFTDFHVDFGGSSVFYHILSGSKTFYLVEPTPEHLQKYAEWCLSPDQATTFFGDCVGSQCYKLELKAGDTMFVPAGWIHCVYTPTTSIVFGGNFIHSLCVPTQLKVAEIEQRTNIAPKFRFPEFETLHWLAALGYLNSGKDNLETLTTMELDGIMSVVAHLLGQLKATKQRSILPKDERDLIRASVPRRVQRFKGGSIEMLRLLGGMVSTVLATRNALGEELKSLMKELEAPGDVAANHPTPVTVGSGAMIASEETNAPGETAAFEENAVAAETVSSEESTVMVASEEHMVTEETKASDETNATEKTAVTEEAVATKETAAAEEIVIVKETAAAEEAVIVNFESPRQLSADSPQEPLAESPREPAIKSFREPPVEFPRESSAELSMSRTNSAGSETSTLFQVSTSEFFPEVEIAVDSKASKACSDLRAVSRISGTDAADTVHALKVSEVDIGPASDIRNSERKKRLVEDLAEVKDDEEPLGRVKKRKSAKLSRAH